MSQPWADSDINNIVIEKKQIYVFFNLSPNFRDSECQSDSNIIEISDSGSDTNSNNFDIDDSYSGSYYELNKDILLLDKIRYIIIVILNY